MKRGRVLLAIALIVAAAAVLSVLAVTARDSDGTAKPTGAETRLRIQPLSDTASCDTTVAVQIYLDDLEARPSLATAGVNRGMVAFEMTLGYDRSVLILEAPLDVELNRGLDREDPDGDGFGRSFLPAPVTIDNYEGTVYFGAVGIPGGPDPDIQEEGPDPVAKGEPLLLYTLRFRAIGEGTTLLRPDPETIDELRLGISDSTITPYEPVVEEASVTVEGGACPQLPTATPRPRPTPTPGPATPTPIIVRTPVPVGATPAALGGRPDCPEGWNVYNDPDSRFSLCYPPASQAVAGAAVEPGTLGVTVQSSSPSLTVTTYWTPRSPYASGLIGSRCELDAELWQVPVVEVPMTIAGVEVVACRGQGAAEYRGVDPLAVEIPYPTGGWIQVFAFRAGPELAAAEEMTTAILGSLQMGPESSE